MNEWMNIFNGKNHRTRRAIRPLTESEQHAYTRYAAAPGRGSNPRPLVRKSDTLPLRHYATLPILSYKWWFLAAYSLVATDAGTISTGNFAHLHNHNAWLCQANRLHY